MSGIIQFTSSNTFSNTQATISLSGVSGGNALVLLLSCYNGSAGNNHGAPNVTDSVNGTLSQAIVPTGSGVISNANLQSGVWFVNGVSSGSHTVTVDYSVQGIQITHIELTLLEVNGIVAFDNGTAANATTAQTNTAGPITTNEANSLTFGVLTTHSAGGVTNMGVSLPAGFTAELHAQQNTSTTIGCEHSYFISNIVVTESAIWNWTDATTNGSQAVIGAFVLQVAGRGMDLTKVGPGKLRLPPRSSDTFVVSSSPPSLPTSPFMQGPGIQPNSNLQFVTTPRSTAILGTLAPMAGQLPVVSTFYGNLTRVTPPVPFLPGPGAPGPSPFNNLQFSTFPYATTQPSALPTIIPPGILQTNSLFYGQLVGAGALTGYLPPNSTVFGLATGLVQGTLAGYLQSNSTFYGSLTGSGALAGVLLTNTLITASQVGGGFQPFVPNTPVLDVRSDSGYEPWTVRPGSTIG